MCEFPRVHHHNGLNLVLLHIDFVEDGDQISCSFPSPVLGPRDDGPPCFDQGNRFLLDRGRFVKATVGQSEKNILLQFQFCK